MLQVWDRGVQHPASGAAGGSAQGVKGKGRSEQHDTAGRVSPLHGRAAGDAPGVWGHQTLSTLYPACVCIVLTAASLALIHLDNKNNMEC